jgi:hypothetical protein
MESVVFACGLSLACLSCAGTARKPLATPTAVTVDSSAKMSDAPLPRIKDSAPERAAALRAANPGLQLEGDEQRWGIEAARERKRATDERADQDRQKAARAKAIVPVFPGSATPASPPSPPSSPSPATGPAAASPAVP